MAQALRALISSAVLAAACVVSAPGVAGPPVLRSPNWAELSPADRQILLPLAGEWNQLDTQRREKSLCIAKRYPSISPTEQQRDPCGVDVDD